MHSNLLGFAGVAALVTIAPAADFALVSRVALTSGLRSATTTAAGIGCGVLVWGALSGVGIAALIAASDTAYSILRLLGAAYLIVLGVLALRKARRAGASRELAGRGSAQHRPFRLGLATNLLNPKVGVFYATVLPQFISHGDSVLLVSMLFAAVHAIMGVAWYTASATLVVRGRSVYSRPKVRATLDSITGCVLIGLGVRVALQRR